MTTPRLLIPIELDGDDRRAVVVDADGATLLNRVLPPEPADFFAEVLAQGPALALFEEPAALDGGLAEVVASAAVDAAYVPGAAGRRAHDFDPGRPREVGRRATMLAAEARQRPNLLRALPSAPPEGAAPLVEEDRLLHQEAVRYLGQLHQFLEQRYPEVAAVLGLHLDQPAVLTLLERYSTPDDLRAAGRRRLHALLRREAPEVADRLLASLLTALALPESTSELPNVERVIPNRAGVLLRTLARRAKVSDEYAALLPPHPLAG